MAKITFKVGEEYARKLSQLAAGSEEIAGKALRAGAGIIADEIRKNLTANLNDPASASKSGSTMFKNLYNETSGSLLESLGITPVSMDRDGVWNIKIGFGDPDYDPKGVSNLLKARVMESGSSTIRKRPFVRPALDAKEDAAKAEIEKVIDEEIEKIMGG